MARDLALLILRNGLARFHKPTRRITMECCPRFVDVTQPDAQQFPGWPVTIHQQDNYARQPLAWLPTLRIQGSPHPVVQVVDEYNAQIVYTLRIRGDTFRPKVFRAGSYTLHVGEEPRRKTLTGIASVAEQDPAELPIDLGTP